MLNMKLKMVDNKVARLKDFSDFLVPKESCNVCGSIDRDEWAKADPIVAYKCANCGLVYHDMQLNREGRDSFYASGYFELHNDPEEAKARDVMYEIEIGFLEKYCQSGKILDVGCGSGFLLNKFSHSWEKYGIEFDITSAQHARDVLKLNVQQGEVNEITHPNNFFDVIVLRGVIEHMSDPKTMIVYLTPWLKKGGFLYITSTPNVESLCAELYKEKWKLFTADHQLHFAKRTIVQMCQEIGFSLDASAYLYLETPYAHEIEDYKNIIIDSQLIALGKKEEIDSSPAFYGNMLSLIFKKNS